jgi:hypothetical protein
MGATKESNGDLPKGTKKKTYVLKLSLVAWNQLDKEMGGKPKKSSNLKKGFPSNKDSFQNGGNMNYLLNHWHPLHIKRTQKYQRRASKALG